MSALRLLWLFPCLGLSVWAAAPAKPDLDPKRIINGSHRFLKEREPEMSAEEYAVYEKVAAMLATQPALAQQLLQAMLTPGQDPSPAFEFILGNVHYASGDSGAAEGCYRRAVEKYPTFLRAWINLGVLYYSNERYADAIPCFTRATTLGDREPSTYGLLGFCLERQGQSVPAELAYMQALAGEPTGENWKEGLLRIYLAGRQWARAESLAKDLAQAHPREGRFWLAYANVLVGDHRPLQAIAVLETADAAGGAGASELALLGDLYAEQQLHREAVAVYLRLQRNSAEWGEEKLLRYARALASSGKRAEALALLDGLPPTISPASQLAARRNRAGLYALEHRWTDARREWQAVLAREPLDGAALLGVGQTCAAENDFAGATFAFEAACQVPAVAPRAYLEWANLELKNRHYEKAIEFLERSLALESNPMVEDHLARLRSHTAKPPAS